MGDWNTYAEEKCKIMPSSPIFDHKTNAISSSSSRWEKPLRKQWSVFGIKYAPLMLPLERRLQTLAVSFWIVLYLFLWMVTVTAMYRLMYTSYWWLSALYITWIVYDLETCNRGGRKGIVVRWCRSWTMWKLYAGYFPVKLIKTTDLDPKKVNSPWKVILRRER